MSEMTRAQQTARMLALLDESFQARARGDQAGFDRLAQEAVQLDVDCVSVIQGGILIGEIPNPERDYAAWSDYVAAAQEQADRPEHRKLTPWPRCPHGCGLLQWVDDQYRCPDCGDEWAFETVHRELASAQDAPESEDRRG